MKPPAAALRSVTRLVARVFFASFTSFATLDLRAQESAPAGAEVVELPKITVTDSQILPPPESWRYARIDGFEILSNASDVEAGRLVQDFQRFHQALIVAWPAANVRDAAPASLILCGGSEKFEAFLPRHHAEPDRSLVSLSLRDAQSAAIVLDLQAKTLNLTTPEVTAALAAATAATAAVDGAEDATSDITSGLPDFLVDHYRQLYREYIRFILARIEPRAPAWLEEGLSQIFMRMEFSPSLIVVGRLESATTAGTTAIANTIEDRDFNLALQRRALLPMNDLFTVGHDDPAAKNPLGNLWAKQCYAFVHYGLYGDNGRHQKAFLTFVSRTAREPATEALFKECFGRSYAQFLSDLRSYVEFTPYTSAEFRAPKGKRLPEPPRPEFREATQSEIGRIKGEALGLAGNTAAAREALLAPYIRGERDPSLLAALGLNERAHGDPARSRKFLEAATQAKVAQPRAYLELARIRHADALAQPAAPDGKFNADQVAGVLRPLFAARNYPPALPEVYELIADTWSRSAVRPTAQNLEVIDEGVRLFVRRAPWILQAAKLKARHNFNEDAANLADVGLKITRDPALREQFTQLKASLPASASSQPTPTPAPAPTPR